MSLVIEGEHLHRLCLMCNPIGYCIYAFIRTPHTPSPKSRMFNVYVESGKKKPLNWFDLVRTPLNFHLPFPARDNSGSDPAVCSRKIKTKTV